MSFDLYNMFIIIIKASKGDQYKEKMPNNIIAMSIAI